MDRKELPTSTKSPAFLVPAVILTIATLTSCSSSDDSSNTQSASPFVGTWASGCFLSDTDPFEYSDETIVVETDTFTYSFNTHSASDCSDSPIVPASGVLQGSYTEISDITTTDGLTAREVDYIVETTELVDGTVVDGQLDGQTVMDIIYIDDAGLLYFGDGDLESKTEARPDALNLNLGYTRQ
jgi:hypothetical protein